MGWAVAALAALLLAGCGGGSGGGGSAPVAVPPVPTALAASAADAAVTLTWAASTGATTYAIERASSAAGPFVEVGSTSALTYSDTGLRNGSTVYYEVVARSAAGSSAPSAAVEATPRAAVTVPATPTDLAATASDSRIDLRWSSVDAATAYVLERADGANGAYAVAATPSSPPYTDATVTNGIAYRYRVSARNAAGTSAPSASVTATPLMALTAPDAPPALTAAAGDGTVMLTWGAAARATGYTVTRSAGVGGAVTTVGTTGATAFADGSVTNGTTYDYVVYATNGAGQSPPSVMASATPTPALTPPPAPATLVATAADRTVALRWLPAPRAVTYVVLRGLSAGGTLLPIATTTATGFLDQGLTDGTVYYYAVSGQNAAGTGPASARVPATPTAALTPPAAPAKLTASAHDRSAALSWVASSGATAYHVLRATSAGGPFAVVATTTGTSWTDSNLTNGVTYHYAVIASNDAGSSAPSLQATVTPDTVPAVPGAPTAQPSGTTVTLAWTAVSLADGYRVWRAPGGSGGFTPLGTTADTRFVDATVAPGSSYRYAISAYNALGSSDPSPAVTVAVPIPSSLAVSTAALLPAGGVNVPYTSDLASSGGTPGYRWTLAAGALPPGVTLNTNGHLAGAPTGAGLYTFTATVSDAATVPATASQTFLIRVTAGGATAALEASTISGGVALAAGYAGLSYEKAKLSGAFFSADNAPLVALLTRLGPGLLRVGGNSVDATRWQPAGPGLTTGALAPADLTRLGAFLRATNWKVLYALPFLDESVSPAVITDPAAVSAEAVAALRALGDRLQAFELGNEPDEYYQRVAGFGYADFRSHWEVNRQAVLDAVAAARRVGSLAAGPAPSFSGPASAEDDVGFTVPFAADESGRVDLLTRHYYRGDGRLPGSTMDLLLSPDPALDGKLATWLAATRRAGARGGLRIAETNSFFNHGAPGVSNAFGSALWVLNYLFGTASAGASGVNLHGGFAGPTYTPIEDNEHAVTDVRPIYYGLTLFSLAEAGTLVPCRLTGPVAGLSAYCVATGAGLNVVLVNASRTVARDVTVTLPASASTARYLTLTGSSVDATTGHRLGGAAIGVDGSWTPLAGPALPVVAGAVTVPLPAGSALLLKAR